MGEIQLQHFRDGLPPPPPVGHSWRRIDRWAEDNYTELYDQLAEGATVNDLNELEYMLDCSLPADVRDSWQIHDGQERGGLPTGIIFGCMLLDCEEIVQEWQQWRKVNQDFLSDHIRVPPPSLARPDVVGASSSSSAASASLPPPSQHQQQHSTATKTTATSADSRSSSHSHHSRKPLWRQELLARQDSQPPGAVRKAYAHPGWIPLARDWGGNNIAVDLAPGPAGTWGQVIVFGRDFDCKYVVSRSWAHFLAMVADDLEGDKWFVDDDTQELKLRAPPPLAAQDPGYLEVLRWRMDEKYGGRKGPRRKPGALAVPAPTNGSATTSSGAANGLSPLISPVGADFERGRSMHRPAGGASAATAAGPVPIPRSSQPGRSSPLARVAEEPLGGVRTHTAMSGGARDKDVTKAGIARPKPAKLVEAPTPAPIYDGGSETKHGSSSSGSSDNDDADNLVDDDGDDDDASGSAPALMDSVVVIGAAGDDDDVSEQQASSGEKKAAVAVNGLGVDGVDGVGPKNNGGASAAADADANASADASVKTGEDGNAGARARADVNGDDADGGELKTVQL
jgi:cell wall assembly regulator SMI1